MSVDSKSVVLSDHFNYSDAEMLLPNDNKLSVAFASFNSLRTLCQKAENVLMLFPKVRILEKKKVTQYQLLYLNIRQYGENSLFAISSYTVLVFIIYYRVCLGALPSSFSIFQWHDRTLPSK